MPENYSVKAALGVDDHGFTQKMNQAADSVEKLDDASQKTSSSILDIAKGVGSFRVVEMAADALKASLSDAIDRFDTLNQYPKVMQNLGYTTEEASASLDKLSDGIQGVPTALDDAATYTKQWALATDDLDKATDLYLAINDGAIAYGASAEQAASCQEQLNQMISAGSYDLQSWKTINQNCPGLLDAVAQSIMGESAAAGDLRTALNEGSVSTEQFESTLISLDQNGTDSVTAFSVAAQTASGGINTSVTNMKTAVVRGMENIVRSTNDALENNGLPGFQGMVEGATSKIDSAFKVAADGAEVFVNSLDVLVPVLGTATAGFIAYKAAMDVSKKASSFKETMLKAVDTLTAVRDKTVLATTATSAQESATISAEIAEKRLAEARSLGKEATKASTAAKKLSTEATKAQKKADTAAEKAERLKIQATKDQEAADRAAKRVQESKTASTKLQERAEIAAAKAEESRIVATEAETAATKLQTKADTLNAAATEAQSTADKKSSIASSAKADAERAETIATTANTHAKEASTAAETSNAKAAEVSNVAIAAKTALLGVLSGEYTLAEAGQLAWNAAMTANTIGTVITSVAALAAILVGITQVLKKLDGDYESLSSRMKDSQKATDELIESQEESKSTYEDSMKETENTTAAVEKLAGETAELAKKTNCTSSEEAQLKANVESLNKSVDGLNLAYDEETGLLNMSTDALKEKAKAYADQEKGTKYLERRNEVLAEQEEISSQLEDAKALLAEAEDSYNQSLEKGNETSAYAAIQMKEQEEAVKSLEEKKKSLGVEEEELAGKIAACSQAQTEAVKSAQAEQQAALAESIANQTVSLGQLSEANQETVNTLKDVWQDYVDSATDMFDTLSDEQTMSVDEMISNLQKNQEVISQWGDNMESLRDRFSNLHLSQGVLDDLADMGPEGAGYVAALATASDEQLAVLAQSFDNGGTVAKESLMESLGVDSNEIPEAIQKMFTQTEESLRTTIEGTDWTSIGGDITSGLAGGIDGGSGDVATSAGNLGTDAENALRDTTQTHSPSAVFEGIGQDLVAGLAQGLMDNGVAKEAAVQMAQSITQIVQDTLNGADFSTAWNRAFSGMSKAASSSMSNVTSAVKSGMSASTSAVSSGSSSMQRAMDAGMTSMGMVVKTQMASIEKQGVSGMNQFAKAIGDGMSKAKVNAANGVSGITSALSPMQSRFYNSGYYASIGLANGINAGAGRAIAAANSLANRVASTMEKALKVGSPSRVTREIGGYTTEGFALGLLDEIQDVKEAALEVAQMAIPTGDIASRISYAGESVMDSAHDYLNTGGGAAYTIVVPVEIEGREVARASATYMQEELDNMEKFQNYRKGYR